MDETPPPGLRPPQAARAIAERKARAVHARLPGELILAADTIVHVDGEMLGKPRDAADAVRMLSLLSGRRHSVSTGVALIRGERMKSGVETAHVDFRELGDEEVRAYVATGEPLDKAGAYAIQGGATGFATQLRGDITAIVGLPIRRLLRMLDALGVRLPRYARR